jgi:UDP-N-acetylmuramate--alanine ligase
MIFSPAQHIHFVGIGGSGLSAIARILVERGYKVSGSDRSTNDLTDALARDGATIYHGHDASHIAGADLLIITSAVKDDHVEVAAARAAGIPVYKRQDIMAPLMEGQQVIAVAGTKGKTTTTAMIVHILREIGADPTYIVGGVMGNTGTNAGVGKGEWFVVEADEYDNMFLGLRPNIAVITNIEWDHPDCFPTPDSMFAAFSKFVELLPPGGTLVAASGDDFAIQRLAAEHTHFRGESRKSILYGMGHIGTQWEAVNIRTVEHATHFDMQLRSDPIRVPIAVNIPLPGNHNIMNAMGAILSVQEAGVALAKSIPTLATWWRGWGWT